MARERLESELDRNWPGKSTVHRVIAHHATNVIRDQVLQQRKGSILVEAHVQLSRDDFV